MRVQDEWGNIERLWWRTHPATVRTGHENDGGIDGRRWGGAPNEVGLVTNTSMGVDGHNMRRNGAAFQDQINSTLMKTL